MAQPSSLHAHVPGANDAPRDFTSDDEDHLDHFSGSGSSMSMAITRELRQTEVPVADTTSPISLPPPAEENKQDCVPIIAGAACAAVLVLVIIIAIVILCRRRRKLRSQQKFNDSNPPPYSRAIEMSTTGRSTLEVRPVNNASSLYNMAESEPTVNLQTSAGGDRQPADSQASSKTPSSQSKLDESPGNDEPHERYSKLRLGSPSENSAKDTYATFHNYEKVAEESDLGIPDGSSGHTYEDVESAKN